MISPMSIILNFAMSSADILRLVILLQLGFGFGLGLGLAYYTVAANFANAKTGVTGELSAAPASSSNPTAAAAAEYVQGGGVDDSDADDDDHSTRGIFHPSFGSNRVHSLIIRSEGEDDFMTATTNSLIFSPRPHPSPCSFRSGSTSEIKRQRYPAFRMPASPPQLVDPHWSRLVSPPSLVSPSSLLSSQDSSQDSSQEVETRTESPPLSSSFSPTDNSDKWRSAIFEDSAAAAVLTRIQEHEAATIAQLNGGGSGCCFGSGLGMRAVSSMQSIWEDAIKLVAPPNSPMVDGHLDDVIDIGYVQKILGHSPPHIDMDEFELYFNDVRPTVSAPITKTSTSTSTVTPRSITSKIQRVHRRLLRPFILRRLKASARKHAMDPAQTRTYSQGHPLHSSSPSLDNSPSSSEEKKSLDVGSGEKTLGHMFRLGVNVA